MNDETEYAGLELDPQTRLCEDLASALHAMAQPLTVLRGALGALMVLGTSASDADRYVAHSHTQVERLCSLMSGMRILLDSFQFDATCVPTNLWELVASTVENADSSWRQSGVRISIAEAENEFQVLADPARMEQAIHAVLTAVSTASSQDSEICLAVDRRDGFADLKVHATHADEKKLTAIDRLRLSVAEASIRSQKGLFEYLSDPLRISLKLPLHDSEEQHFELAGSSIFGGQVQARSWSDPKSDELVTQGDDW